MGFMAGSNGSIAHTPECWSKTISCVKESCLLSGMIGDLGRGRATDCDSVFPLDTD